jgi:hypothetical protein
MKPPIRNPLRVASLLVVTLIVLSTSVEAGSLVYPPQSSVRAHTLQEWLGIYWRWFITGADPAQSVVGKVQLLPLPTPEVAGGSFTPDDPGVLVGNLEITLDKNTPYVLPLFAWISEVYSDGSQDPPFPDAVVLDGVSPEFTIDGTPVVSDDNELAFYVPATAFDPILEYLEPAPNGAVGAASFQGIGLVGKPLREGVHVLHLKQSFILPAGAYSGIPDGIGIIYDNTWTITVTKTK